MESRVTELVAGAATRPSSTNKPACTAGVRSIEKYPPFTATQVPGSSAKLETVSRRSVASSDRRTRVVIPESAWSMLTYHARSGMESLTPRKTRMLRGSSAFTESSGCHTTSWSGVAGVVVEQAAAINPQQSRDQRRTAPHACRAESRP